MKLGCVAIGVGLAIAPLGAAEPGVEEPKPWPVAFSLQGSYNFGDVDGFMQTPSGGKPGTSSPERPTFDELNINDVSFYEGRLDVRWRHLDFFGGYQYIRLDGDGTLSEPLISRG